MPSSQPACFRASLGGQKYHASPHKAIINEKRCDGKNKKKGLRQREKTGGGKGCLVLAEAANIPSSVGQDRLKEAKETKREKASS